MTKKQFRTRLRLLIILTLLLIAMTGFALGKYAQNVPVTGNVTFTARLAASFVLQEHKAVRQPDGSYQLDTDKVVTKNEYFLLPGVDIPKDPHIVITGKTPIEAYLFIEVVDGTGNGALAYGLRKHDDGKTMWVETSLKQPQAQGTVYAYSTDGTNPAEITTDLTAYILQNNKITVGQELLHGDENNQLTFYAYLEEVPPAENP